MGNLSDSIKTPVVYLYNEAGDLLASTLEGKGLGIVEFAYTYEDENEDECRIKIQSQSATWIDSLGISRSSILKVRWGYLTGPLGPLATIAVRDISSKYGPNIVYTEYRCNDLTTYLRLVRAEDIRKMNLIDYITYYAATQVNVVIQSGKDVIYKKYRTQRTIVEEPKAYLPPGTAYHKPLTPYNPIERIIDKRFIKPTEEALPEDKGEWFNTAKWADIKAYFEKELDLVAVNRSPYTILEEYLQTCPYGPWFVTGRGNTLLIHNRNLGGDVYREYAYAKEPGYLLDFTAETKYDSFEKQVISSTNLDPSTKITSNFSAYLERLANARSFKEITSDTSLTVAQRDELLKEFVLNYIAYKRAAVTRVKYDVFTRKYGWENNYSDRGMPSNISRNDYAARANHEQVFIEEGMPNHTPLQYPVGSVLLYYFPIDTPEDAAHREDNTLRKLQMETEEASIIIEGDPFVMSEHVVAITNVQKEHVGKYYIKKCEHTLSQQGYKTTLETTRVKDEAVVRSLRTDYDQNITQDGLKDIFLKQESVFSKWAIEVSFKVPRIVIGIPTEHNLSDYKTETITLDDIFNDPTLGGNPDLIAEKIGEYLGNNQYNLTIQDVKFTDPELR